MKSFFLLSLLHLFTLKVYSQDETKLCKALEKENFGKVERLVKKEINKRNSGTEFDNGPGSGILITHQYNLDTITLWLKNNSCISDAAWDKCQAKIAVYPGFSSIGIKLQTAGGIREKCFYIQEGTTGIIRIFGCTFQLFKAKNKLVYKKMYDCDGFVSTQKKNCAEIKK